ncbi:Sulfate adenylyltransferase [Chthoniobacter flavus Ellin428]|uniref:Sulfate adenylyltransferase n=1 Tax=Chthoniobacter flavus Ellin428 TaxID=497964 RepID=B4D6P6_9BACT|nr:sulfate adenylyltransferase subunit CysD [Chthoniobacter flavus]EDY17847.1 Sulfate adenylyltransferase [Chthoniobacter flavus Ellin428]
MSSYQLDHLQYLETESIHIMREVAAEFERPTILFSGGKDSICLLRLAEKAFRPSDIPMPFLNVDTGHHFPELNEFRDRRAAELGGKLIVRKVEDAIASGIAVPTPGEISRNRLQIPTLLAAIDEFQFDCAIGGARRDEEKARAKERFFSFRDSFGQWDPRNQRPEIWNVYNARVNPGENMRVFPLSNWTEMDIWEYIKREKLEVPAIYFSHKRPGGAPRWSVAAGDGYRSAEGKRGSARDGGPRPHHRRHHQHRSRRKPGYHGRRYHRRDRGRARNRAWFACG